MALKFNVIVCLCSLGGFSWKDLVHFSLVIQHNCQQQKDNNIRTTTSLPQTGNKVDSLIVDKFQLHPSITDVEPLIFISWPLLASTNTLLYY